MSNSNLIDKPFDLEERTFLFSKECRFYLNLLQKTISNIEDGKQMIHSSGSIGANYIEANEKLGDKDFVFRLKIARKEAKKTMYWLKLSQELNLEHRQISESLILEADELRKILSSIISKINH